MDQRSLRTAFGAFPTGVTVVTTLAQGMPVGFTANSFTSVSLDPPLLLISIARSARSSALFADVDRFAVNILAADQADVARRFAQSGIDRFQGIAWQPTPGGMPALAGVAVWFDCTTAQRVDAGDHWLLIGRIQHLADHGHVALRFERGVFSPG